MEYCELRFRTPQSRPSDLDLQREQRGELAGLLKKYGDIWEPWRTERSKFKNKGEDLMKDTQ